MRNHRPSTALPRHPARGLTYCLTLAVFGARLMRRRVRFRERSVERPKSTVPRALHSSARSNQSFLASYFPQRARSSMGSVEAHAPLIRKHSHEARISIAGLAHFTGLHAAQQRDLVF